MNILLRELPSEERPREKLEQRGASALNDAELLALFLRVGRRGASAVQLGQELIDEFGSLQAMAGADIGEICEIKGVGSAKAIQIKAAMELGSRVSRESFSANKLDSAQKVFELLGAEMALLKKESLRVILLNTKLQMLRVSECSLGSVDQCVADPHNHPSGDPAPSMADRQITSRLVDGAKLLNLNFADHVILGTGDGERSYYSFREQGQMG